MSTDSMEIETRRHKRIFIAIDDSVQSGWAAEFGGELAKELSGRHDNSVLLDTTHKYEVARLIAGRFSG